MPIEWDIDLAWLGTLDAGLWFVLGLIVITPLCLWRAKRWNPLYLWIPTLLWANWAVFRLCDAYWDAEAQELAGGALGLWIVGWAIETGRNPVPFIAALLSIADVAFIALLLRFSRDLLLSWLVGILFLAAVPAYLGAALGLLDPDWVVSRWANWIGWAQIALVLLETTGGFRLAGITGNRGDPGRVVVRLSSRALAWSQASGSRGVG